MSLVSYKDVANSNINYAIPQFNVNNQEWLKAILICAQTKNSPVILGFTSSTVSHMCGFKTITAMTINIIDYLGISIPVVLHLDHGSSIECLEAIDSGFTSVMIDASEFQLEENIRLTKIIVDYAHKRGVSVEGQIGNFEVNGKTEKYSVNDCVTLVIKTDIDCLAPSLGNKHGIIDKIDIDFNKMKEIYENTKIPLALHGGSCLSKEQFFKAISNGCKKINVNTENMSIWSMEVRNYLQINKNEYHPRKIINAGIDQMIDSMGKRIDIFGSANKVCME